MSEDRGVALSHYLLHRGCCVRFVCSKCHDARDFPVQDVIDRLKHRGLGSERTGIIQVAKFVERSCQKCGSIRFQTMPGFPAKDVSPFREGLD